MSFNVDTMIDQSIGRTLTGWGQHYFQYRTDDNKTVESVEQRNKIALKAETIHFEEHLQQE